MPAMGTSWAKMVVLVWPYTSLEEHTFGIMERGMPKSSSSSSSHSNVLMLKSIVLEALLTSVTWTSPLVRFHTSHESTVPKRSSPASARALAPGTFSRIQRIFVAEK